jgi:hypothetical protein
VADVLRCTCCPETFEVSEEDPDATLTDVWHHLYVHVPDPDKRRELFVEVQEALDA